MTIFPQSARQNARDFSDEIMNRVTAAEPHEKRTTNVAPDHLIAVAEYIAFSFE